MKSKRFFGWADCGPAQAGRCSSKTLNCCKKLHAARQTEQVRECKQLQCDKLRPKRPVAQLTLGKAILLDCRHQEWNAAR